MVVHTEGFIPNENANLMSAQFNKEGVLKYVTKYVLSEGLKNTEIVLESYTNFM